MPRRLTTRDYETLAGFRHALARFLGFSAAAAAEAGLTPRHYHALLALHGHGRDEPLTIGALAERLLVTHHSAVGLVDRLAALGLVRRVPGRADRRRVHVVVTAKGLRRLEKLASAHRDRLREFAPALRALLDVLDA